MTFSQYKLRQRKGCSHNNDDSTNGLIIVKPLNKSYLKTLGKDGKFHFCKSKHCRVKDLLAYES